MLAPGDHVICALSGGKDSITLLHVLLELQNSLGITVSAAHLNHMLRGEESLRDQQFVREHCAQWRVPLETKTRDVGAYARERGLGIEEAARTLRYDFLLGISTNAKIATAHTADDNLETMLMHLLRGCSLKGLGGIPPVRDRIIRPMLLVERKQVEEYISAHGLPFVEDSTNREDFCLRNRLRHRVIPLLKEEAPQLAEMTSSLCLGISQEENLLEQEAREKLKAATVSGGLSVSMVLSLPEAMALRVLRGYLEGVPELGRVHLEAALTLCRNSLPSARISLPGGWGLFRVYDLLVLGQEGEKPIPADTEISPGEVISFGSYQIRCEASKCPKELPGDTICLRLPQMEKLWLRTRRPGDRISLPGGTKKLSRYLIDEKIPADVRDGLPVLCYGAQIAAVLPLTADKKFRAQPGEDSLMLSLQRMEEVK